MRTLRTSVRRLVEFLLRSGDIDSGEGRRGDVEAMMAGSAIHRTLQAAGGDAYQAEVSLAGSFLFPEGRFSPHAARLDIREETVGGQEGFFLHVEGGADGIIDDGTHPLVIDEIKGVSRDVSAIEEPVAIHEAQALCYAYLYLRRTRAPSALASAHGERVVVRLTYASMTTGEVRQLERTHGVPDIEAWFFSLLEMAQRWAAWRVDHDELRRRSLATLEFPLRPREGQKEIIDAVTSAIHGGMRLYVQAPTGSGKTIATLFPALKAMGSGEVSHIVFLTAKTMTRRAALECLDLLRRQGITLNVLVMTARDKICPLRSSARGASVRSRPLASLCNPAECPRARAHYDSTNDALYEAIVGHDLLDSGSVEALAARWGICPYELQRDAARWSDVIICDYHYAFAPSAGLLGLTDEPGDDGGIVLLIDEAHNLVERMRDSYGAELALADLEGLERLLRRGGGLDELTGAVHAVAAAFPTWKEDPPTDALPHARGRSSRPSYQPARVDEAFEVALTNLAQGIDDAVERILPIAGGTPGGGRRADAPATGTVETYLALRDMGFTIRAFLGALRRAEAGYVTFLAQAEGPVRHTSPRAPGQSSSRDGSQDGWTATDGGRAGWTATDGGRAGWTATDVQRLRWTVPADGDRHPSPARTKHSRRIKIHCVDPSHDLSELLERVRAAVFFSGTLLPLDYHRKLLAARADDASVYARSSFDHHQQQVLIGTDVSSRFSRRGPELYARIAAYLMSLVRARPGNYLAFLPSYAMLAEVADVLEPLTDPGTELVRQRPGMHEDERERFVARFREPRARGTSLVGLCVLGGIFGESIDLPGEALVGVVVVGTGMPRTSAERDVIRDYFDAKEGRGFAYAYSYPGMIKVLQAAGRLIRTERDRGVILLLDDRFLADELREAFPREWQDIRTCTLETLPSLLAHQEGT